MIQHSYLLVLIALSICSGSPSQGVASQPAGTEDSRLIDAVRRNDAEAVRRLLDAHCDPNRVVTLSERTEVPELDSSRAPVFRVSLERHAALESAIYAEPYTLSELVRSLRDLNRWPERSDDWMLTNEEIVRMLLSHGADVNMAIGGLNRESPLHIAYADEKPRIGHLLLAHGARPDVGVLRFRDSTVLDLALSPWRGLPGASEEDLETIVNRNVPLDGVSKHPGEHTIQLAIIHRSWKIVCLLADAGADCLVSGSGYGGTIELLDLMVKAHPEQAKGAVAARAALARAIHRERKLAHRD